MDEMESLGPGEFWVKGYRCYRCGHEWTSRPLRNPERPRICPRCKSASWDRPRPSRRQGSDEYEAC